MSAQSCEVPFLTALLSGGVAGISVDVALYPLDTIKTRLQSSEGFFKAGGFRGLYKGLSAAATGSAPGAALFFSTYEFCKIRLKESGIPAPMIHMLAASCGEVAACSIRVPTEVIKQRMQTGMHSKLEVALNHTFQTHGILGFYHGFGTTLIREIPFAFIQFPIYEAFKKIVGDYKIRNGSSLTSVDAAMCGSVAGAFAAAVTTPLDVIKTRIMLGSDAKGIPYKGFFDTFSRLCIEGKERETIRVGGGVVVEGSSKGSLLGNYRIFFAGVGPRTMWIGIGGFVFFGAYNMSVTSISHLL